MNLGHLGLPILTLGEGPSEKHVYETRLCLIYYKFLNAVPIAVEKRAALENDIRVQDLNGKHISYGCGSFLFDLDMLVLWWLWRANQVGISTADKDLEKFLSANQITFLAVLWVYGVEPAETISITDDIRIVPVKEMPDCGEKEEIFRSKWRFRQAPAPVPSAALVTEIEIEKISLTDHDISRPRPDYFSPLYEIVLLLNVLPDVCCVAGFQTSYAPTNVPLGPFGGRGGGYSMNDILPKNKISHLTSECKIPLQRLISGFGNLSDSWKERITRSIVRLSQSKSRIDDNDKALDLGIALEMVLLHSEHRGSKFPGQLSNHFRARGAWLIGECYDDRKRYYGELGEIYSNRSQVAHNGVLSKSKDAGSLQRGEQIQEHYSIAEKILKKLILDEPPANWAALVLGEDA